MPGPSSDFERKDAIVDGLQVSYLERGRPRPHLPSVVMLHGMVSGAESFRPIVERLPAEWHVVAIDMPLLDAKRRGDATLAGFARDVQRVAQAAGVVESVYLGHSHGGAVSLQIATQTQVRGLVLLCPAHPFSGKERPVVAFYQSRLGRLAAHVMPFMPERILIAGVDRMSGPKKNVSRERRSVYARMMKRRHLVRPILKVLDTWWTDLDTLRACLERAPLAVPVLLLWGDRDNVVPASTAPALLAHLPQAEYVELPDIGHLPNEEAPDACAESIRRWWSDCQFG